MALGGATTVPEQPERGFQCPPMSAPVLSTARLQGQTLSLGFAPSFLLTIMGQLSKRFVVQHVHPSFPCEFECVL